MAYVKCANYKISLLISLLLSPKTFLLLRDLKRGRSQKNQYPFAALHPTPALTVMSKG